MSLRITKYLLLLPLTISLFGINLVAQEVEEVIVTSTKKATSVQDLALSVQALTSTDMVEAQITETEDMAELIPGFIQSPGIGSGTNVGIRGLIGTAVGANTTASVQSHINGLQVNSSVFTTIGFFDSSQIEILSGPQGTLFGRNATGGIINVTTTAPEHNFEGSMKFDIGQGGQTRMTYAQNFDLTDKLAARIAVQSYEKDGQIYNLETGNNIDDRSTEDYRISLNYTINDTTELDFIHQSHSADDNRSHFTANRCERDPFYGCLPWEEGQLNAPGYTSGSVDGLFGILAQTNNYEDEYANSIYPSSIDEVNRDFDPHTKQTFDLTQIILTKQFDNFELKVRASTSDRDYLRTGDVDGSVASEGFTSGINHAIMNAGVYAQVEAGVLAAGGQTGLDAGVLDQDDIDSLTLDEYQAGVLAGTYPVFDNSNNQFEMQLDLPCLDGVRTFKGDSSYECSDVVETTDQVEINIVSDFDGPVNFVAGLFAWESDNHNTFYTHTASYNVLRDFDLHPLSNYFAVGNGALPELQGQGYGGLAFYQTFLGWAQSNFSETYDLENPFFDNEDGYSAIDPDLELSCAQLLAAGQNPLGCNEILQSELDFVTYMAAADNLLAQLGQPAAFKRTVPIQLGGLIQDNPVVQESVAFYANVFYDLSDDTKLTFGYRVNEDKYDDYAFNALGDVLNADYRYSPVYDLYTLAGTVEESNEAFRTKGEDTAETFKLAIQHNLNDDTMVYASYSTGNKPGGSTPDQYGNPTVFAPETVDSFELGLRSILMDGRMLMNLTAFSMEFQDAHTSQVVGSAAITNSLDYTHNGLEGQMRFFVNEATSIDFNFLALDSTIDDGEELFNPLNPNGASEILDIYNLTDEDDVARMALALDALVADGSISSQSLQLPNPIAGGGGGYSCAQLEALGSAAGVAGVTAATLGCDALIGGTGASYLGLLTSNPDAGDLLPFLLIGLTDTGMIANYQGRNLSRGRWVADSDAFAALPLPWLAADYLVPLGGTRTPFTSELDYNIAVNHSMAVMSGMLDLKLTYSHKGDTNGDLFESPLTYVPEQDYFDLYGNWTPNDGDYYVGFYIKNLEDSRNLAGSRTTSEMVGGPANLYFTQPRTAGLTFGLNF
ncbi:TonB-dependent receptor plug domain-containing protein [Gammaproteobacteria bacterium]|nr:TonB-dependent receptor plug domain-containing protein [Gammaproteobacteria bacterium]